jgi:hypothetical protein
MSEQWTNIQCKQLLTFNECIVNKCLFCTVYTLTRWDSVRRILFYIGSMWLFAFITYLVSLNATCCCKLSYSFILHNIIAFYPSIFLTAFWLKLSSLNFGYGFCFSLSLWEVAFSRNTCFHGCLSGLWYSKRSVFMNFICISMGVYALFWFVFHAKVWYI